MKDKILKTVTPESVGVPSEAVLNYVNTLEKKGVNLHSFIMLKDGKIFAEGYYPPFSEEKLQRLYSVSKSFTAVAIGLMQDEGKIKISDKICKYFPEYLPQNIHPFLSDMKIEDMLKMSTCFTDYMDFEFDSKWKEKYFSYKPDHPAGTIFRYSTMATHMLAVLVEKLSGKKLLDYMRERMLDETGFSKDAWCVEAPDGSSWGGSGIMATLRDLAKFAEVLLNGGRFNGKQLISEEFVKKATTTQIDIDVDEGGFWKGYGYQIWTMKDGSFCFRGMGSQHAICIPHKNMVVCLTCDNQGIPNNDALIFEELFERFVPAVTDEKLTEGKAFDDLAKKCKTLCLKLQKGEMKSSYDKIINGAAYKLSDNVMNISKVKFLLNDDEGAVTLFTERGEKTVKFGFGKNVAFEFPEDYYYERIGTKSKKHYPALASAAWTDDMKLTVRIYTVGAYLGNITMAFSFKGDDIGIMMIKNAEWFFDEYHGYAGGTKEE